MDKIAGFYTVPCSSVLAQADATFWNGANVTKPAEGTVSQAQASPSDPSSGSTCSLWA